MSIYLYVKRCTHCGLKYFGKTVRDDVEKYNGSGKYWKRHINLHGLDNIATDQIWKFDDQCSATDFALKFTKDNNIVESLTWANLIPEDGKDGNSSAVITEELRKKFQKANAGKNNPQYGTKWINNGTLNKKIKQDDIIPEGWSQGRYFDETHRKKFSSRSKKEKNNPRYNHKIYCFHNVKTDEHVNLTAMDFYLGRKINPKGIRKLIQGHLLIYKDWEILN